MNKDEKKLAKVVRKSQNLEEHLTLITTPKLWEFIERLCRDHLEFNLRDNPSRELIARFALTFRQEAYQRFGHDTLETFALAKLLKMTASPVPASKVGRPDAITHINSSSNRNARLDALEMSAAENIRTVWEHFGKFMFIGARGMEAGGKRSHVLEPVDLMGEEFWEHYKTFYVPWYQLAKAAPVDRRRAGAQVTLAQLVFRIIVEDVWPEQLDQAFCLQRGGALLAFKAALGAYWEPGRLEGWGQGRPQTAKIRPASGVAGAGRGK